MTKDKILRITLFVVLSIGALLFVRHLILDGAAPATPNQNPVSTQVSNSINNVGTSSAVPTPRVEGKDFTIKDTKYFDGRAWAVVNIAPVEENSADSAAYIIMHLSDKTYQTVLGPGGVFPSDILKNKNVPADVTEYLNKNGLVSEPL